MVANKLSLIMWYTDKIHGGRLDDRLDTMGQRPHDNLVLVAKGHMQYRWFRSNLKEQEVVRKENMTLKAHIAVEDGHEFDALVGQVMESGDNNSSPGRWPRMSSSPKRKILRLIPI